MLLRNILSRRSVIVAASLCFLCYLTHRILLISFPHPNSGGVENNVIWFIQRILDGGNLYTDPEKSPYAIAQYTPFYYYLNAGVARIFGIKPEDVLSLFAISRSVSLMLNLAFAGVVYLIVKKVGNKGTFEAIIPAIFSFIFLDITLFSRPDSLSQFFFILWFYFFIRFVKNRQTNQKTGLLSHLSAVFAVCALFSKQSAIILPLIVCGWFIREKNYKHLLGWGSVFLTGVVVMLIIINVESGLSSFYQNTVNGVNNGIGLLWFLNNIVEEFYVKFGLLWVPALIFILFFTKRKDQEYRFIRLSLLCLFVFTNLIALKWGSSPGYFTDWCTLVFIGVAIYAVDLPQLSETFYRKFAYAVLIFIVLIKAVLLIDPIWTMIKPGARNESIKKYEEELRIATVLNKKLEEAPGHTVFNNVYSPDVFLNNLMFRSSTMPQFEIVIFGTWHRKVFNYSRFRKDVNDGTIKYVVVDKSGPLQFMDITFEQYIAEDSSYGKYRIFKFDR